MVEIVRQEELKVTIPETGDTVSALLEIPRSAKALLVLAHGAGAGMRHPWLNALAESLHAVGIATFRYQFPYMENGGKRPDRPATAVAAVAAAVAAAERAAPRLPLLAGGKSFGARMTTTAAAQGRLPTAVRGLVCFGFPLHPAKKPSIARAAHLSDVRLPILFLQGTRDALADLALLGPLVKKHTLHVVEGADHGFAVLKSSGRTAADVLTELAEATRAFRDARLGTGRK